MTGDGGDCGGEGAAVNPAAAVAPAVSSAEVGCTQGAVPAATVGAEVRGGGGFGGGDGGIGGGDVGGGDGRGGGGGGCGSGGAGGRGGGVAWGLEPLAARAAATATVVVMAALAGRYTAARLSRCTRRLRCGTRTPLSVTSHSSATARRCAVKQSAAVAASMSELANPAASYAAATPIGKVRPHTARIRDVARRGRVHKRVPSVTSKAVRLASLTLNSAKNRREGDSGGSHGRRTPASVALKSTGAVPAGGGR